MTKRAFVAIAAAVVGLAASIASGIDEVGPAFCAESGCETVRSSAWAAPLGIPMAVFGIGFFAVMLILSFVERPRLRKALAIAGGAWAVWLIALQAFVIGAWCKLCLVADPAAIVLAIAVLWGAPVIAVRWSRLATVATGTAMMLGALAMWTRAPDQPPLERPVVAATDRVTIVEMVDFECPFCREMQKRLDAAIARTNVPVSVVRKMVPLRMHRGAMPAALAWCCADEQGKGEEMARALFEADPADLTTEGCEQIAARIGCDVERFRAARPHAEQRVVADLAEAKQAGVRGLPTLFIGNHSITGASASTDELVAMIESAVK
jgi:protein-disulfide isomerase/uncharacterized membrane protein